MGFKSVKDHQLLNRRISLKVYLYAQFYFSLSLSLSLSLRLPVSFHSWLVFLIDVPVNFEHWKGLFVNSIFEKD